MTIINPKSIAGVTSITTPSGSDNLFTVHTNNTTERVRINNDGDVIVGSGITVSPDGDIFTTGVTTSTTFVGALTGNVTGTASGNAVLTGSTNNQVVTVTGANAIAGESGLTFNGNALTVTNSSSNTAATFQGAGGAGFIAIKDGDDSTVAYIGVDGGKLKFQTSGSSYSDKLLIDTDGRVIIGDTDTDNAFSGGDSLVIGNTSSGTRSGITLVSANDQDSGIYFSDGTSSGNANVQGQIVYDHSNSFVRFYTAAGERMRIDSDGRVGIKNTNMSSFNDGMDDLVIGNGTNGTSPGMTIYSNSSDIGSISFRDSADTGISGLIQYRHMESPPYMRFMVENSNIAKFTTSGLCFGSDTAAANALDDYEEGTWTPVWAAGGSASGLTNIANCEYVKIGELVHVRGEFSLTGGSGNVSTVDGWYITGLPFPNNDASGSAGTWWMSSSWTSGTRATGLVMSYGTNILYFGTEYASGMGRLTNIRHFAVTYRTN